MRVDVDDLLDVAAELEQVPPALEIDARLRQPRAQLERGLARLLAIAGGVELAEDLDRRPPRGRRPASASVGFSALPQQRKTSPPLSWRDRQPERLELGAQRVDVRLALARRAPVLG